MQPTDINTDLTQEQLKLILKYESDTGIFRWLVSRPNGVKPNDIAGAVADSGYRRIKINNRSYAAHRLACLYMTGEWPLSVVDHIDADKLNNSWVNLRQANHQQNAGNAKLSKANITGLKGVSPNRHQWQANIRVAGKLRFLGRFDSPEAAHRAYLTAAETHFGQYVRGN